MKSWESRERSAAPECELDAEESTYATKQLEETDAIDNASAPTKIDSVFAPNLD